MSSLSSCICSVVVFMSSGPHLPPHQLRTTRGANRRQENTENTSRKYGMSRAQRGRFAYPNSPHTAPIIRSLPRVHNQYSYLYSYKYSSSFDSPFPCWQRQSIRSIVNDVQV